MSNTNKRPRTSSTVERAFDILERLEQLEGARISELGEELDIANSTIHRHLQTLYSRGYVVKEGDKYHLGLSFLRLGQTAQTRREVYEQSEQIIADLADETGERAQFVVEEHGQVVWVHRKWGEHAVRTDPGLGRTAPIHATAAGKVILAFLPHNEVEDILDDHELKRHTDETIQDRRVLQEELETIRDRRYSFNNEENIEGLKAVAVPVLDQTDKVVGSISVSGPAHRMKGNRFENELPEKLLGSANELELNIAYQ